TPQTQVNMPVDDAGHDRAGKLRDSSPLRSFTSQGDRPQLMINQLDDCRSESTADPEIINSKLHDHVPILVRTAYSSGKNVRSRAFCRKRTPEEPPVPVLKPMVRCTVRRWRNRQNWKLSSTSIRDSQAS